MAMDEDPTIRGMYCVDAQWQLCCGQSARLAKTFYQGRFFSLFYLFGGSCEFNHLGHLTPIAYEKCVHERSRCPSVECLINYKYKVCWGSAPGPEQAPACLQSHLCSLYVIEDRSLIVDSLSPPSFCSFNSSFCCPAAVFVQLGLLSISNLTSNADLYSFHKRTLQYAGVFRFSSQHCRWHNFPEKLNSNRKV